MQNSSIDHSFSYVITSRSEKLTKRFDGKYLSSISQTDSRLFKADHRFYYFVFLHIRLKS